MKKTLEQAALLAVLLVLAGCAGNEPAEPKWEEHLYRTVVYNSGEDESDAKYLESHSAARNYCLCWRKKQVRLSWTHTIIRRWMMRVRPYIP